VPWLGVVDVLRPSSTWRLTEKGGRPGECGISLFSSKSSILATKKSPIGEANVGTNLGGETMTVTFLYDNREASTVAIVQEDLAEVLAVEVTNPHCIGYLVMKPPRYT
jgi:hypothetical protein